MNMPIINVQEAHELILRTPEIKGDPASLSIKFPYSDFVMIFKHADTTYFIKCHKFPDSITVFNGDGVVQDNIRSYITPYILLDTLKESVPLGLIHLYDEVVFGTGAKPQFPYTPPTNTFNDFQERFQDCLNLAGSVVLFSLKLMQCKNITYVDYDPNKSLPWRKRKKGEKKAKPPFIKYKILQIEPLKQRQLEINRPSSEPGIDQRLHTVRGHFKTFTAERPLFGRAVGTYWWGDCIKGNPAFGLIEKDYEIKIGRKLLKTLEASD